MSIHSSVLKKYQLHHNTMKKIAASLVNSINYNVNSSISAQTISTISAKFEVSDMWKNQYPKGGAVASLKPELIYSPQLNRKYPIQISDSLRSIKETYNIADKIYKSVGLNNSNVSLYNSKLTTQSIKVSNIAASISTMLSVGIKNVDFTGFDKLDISSLVDSELEDSKHNIIEAAANLNATSEVTASITVAKSNNISDSEVDNLVKKYTDLNGKFSLKNFVIALFEAYVLSEALKVLGVILSTIIALNKGAINAELKSEIEAHFNYESTYRETRKIITKYIMVFPTDQVAFLREEIYLRKGSSKSAPIVSNTKISTKSVLTIIERKKNWLKVEVDTGESYGEIGWVQESKIIKFKKG
ncbi:hypothetical protein [Cytobacillus praedii]|uniref:hypothetical protein n=1 Tax=Cytobacillus praedii TaxID=1742358 RepID=UPI002E24CDF1|nr:hypothetical protein [Cytobacillus praedii]